MEARIMLISLSHTMQQALGQGSGLLVNIPSPALLAPSQFPNQTLAKRPPEASPDACFITVKPEFPMLLSE